MLATSEELCAQYQIIEGVRLEDLAGIDQDGTVQN